MLRRVHTSLQLKNNEQDALKMPRSRLSSFALCCFWCSEHRSCTGGAHITVTLSCDPVLVCVDWRGIHTNSNQWGFWGFSWRKEGICCSVSVDNDRSRLQPPAVRHLAVHALRWAMKNTLIGRRRWWAHLPCLRYYALPLHAFVLTCLWWLIATSSDHSCHSILHLMTRNTSSSWSWARPLLQSKQFSAEIRVKDISYWYGEQRMQGECRKLLMHMQQMRVCEATADRRVPSSVEVRWAF